MKFEMVTKSDQILGFGENKREINYCMLASYLSYVVPRTGLEPARLAALAPETSASTIPPPGLVIYAKLRIFGESCKIS